MTPREEILMVFGKLSEEAEICHQLGLVADYMAKNYTRSDGSFTTFVSINMFEGEEERQTWEAYQYNFGDDRELHANMGRAKYLDEYMMTLLRNEAGRSDLHRQRIREYINGKIL